MKRFFLAVACVVLLLSCDKETGRNNNPYLPSYNFSADLNLNLPAYSQLNSDGNALAITVSGDIDVVIMKIGTEYRAWNGNCPNQSPTSCSRLTASGLTAKCGCDDAYVYSMFDGTALGAQYTMVAYRVQVLGGNNIRVYN